jgi:hypothetical protein
VWLCLRDTIGRHFADEIYIFGNDPAAGDCRIVESYTLQNGGRMLQTNMQCANYFSAVSIGNL